MKVEKKQSFTEKVLAHVRRVAEKNAGIPSSKGMFEAQVPTKLKEVREGPAGKLRIALVGIIKLVPMTTTCRMFIGLPEVPEELIQ